jgi:hypothetical protein
LARFLLTKKTFALGTILARGRNPLWLKDLRRAGAASSKCLWLRHLQLGMILAIASSVPTSVAGEVIPVSVDAQPFGLAYRRLTTLDVNQKAFGLFQGRASDVDQRARLDVEDREPTVRLLFDFVLVHG